MINLLHIADVHLDAKFGYLPHPNQLERREDIRTTFKRIIDYAIAHRVDVVIIAGDLFDSNTPSRSTLQFVIDQFMRLLHSEIKVIITPGTHDPFCTGSIYEHSFPDNVIIFKEPKLSPVILPELDITFYGIACTDTPSHMPILKNLPARSSTKYHVGVIHGSYDFGSLNISLDYYPITTSEIDNTFFDYLALGHYHSYQIGKSRVPVAYPGTVESLDFSDSELGERFMLTVELNDGCKINRHRVNTKTYQLVHIDCSGITTTYEITQRLSQQVNPNHLVCVKLDGLVDVDTELNIDELEAYCKDRFYYLEVIRGYEVISQSAADEHTLRGLFIKKMQQKITNSTDENEKNKLTEALLFGLRALDGKLE